MRWAILPVLLVSSLALAQEGATPWIGLQIDRADRGVLVQKVLEATPGARAGLRAGDVVVELDGAPVATPTELVRRVQDKGVGETVALVVLRGGKPQRFTLALEARPDELDLLRSHLVGKKAPPFALAHAAGPYPARLDALAGNVVLVEFWATWCGPCAASLPRLTSWQEKYGPRGLRVVGLSTESWDVISKHIAAHRVGHTVAEDAGGAVYDTYQVPAVPTWIVIDRKGRVRYVDVGAGSRLDGVEAAFRQLLDERS